MMSSFDDSGKLDTYTRIVLTFRDAVASAVVARGAKSEGTLVITGTAGYAFVPAPWWKTDYFELRFEDAADNRRFFWQLDGQGIRGQLVDFVRAIDEDGSSLLVADEVSRAIAKIVEQFFNEEGVSRI